MSRNVFEIDQGLLGFSLTDPGKTITAATIADYTAFSCQVTKGALQATANTTNKVTPATWCEPEATQVQPGVTSYELVCTFLQDPMISTGISEFLFEHDTDVVWWFMSFDPSSGPPKAMGQCTAVSGTIGGDARTPLTFDVTLPCKAKPVIMFGSGGTTVIVGGAATQGVAGIPGHWNPAGADPPASLAALTSATPPVTASPATAWTTGQYVGLGDGSKAHWSSTAWLVNPA